MMMQDIIFMVALLSIAALGTLFIVSLATKSMDTKKESNEQKSGVLGVKALEHPLFKLTINEIETYLSMVYVKKLIFVIYRDISSLDPNRMEEIYGRTLVEFTADFVDLIPAFDKYMGRDYLGRFATNLFRELQIEGKIGEMVTKYGTR